MRANEQLSTHFDLHELLHSQTATRRAIPEQFDPSDEIVESLRFLCKHILQPIRTRMGHPIKISSGYRCEKLNKAVGGSKNSQHKKGQAADIQDLEAGNERLLEVILELNLPFDQIIDEFGLAWIHISCNPEGTLRKEKLKAIKDGANRTRYVPV